MKKTNFLVATGVAALLSPAWATAEDNMAKRVEMLEQELRALKAEMKQTVAVVEKTSNASAKGGFKGNANTTYSFGGYIKADAMWSDHSDQQRAGNVGDDFLVPSTIATGPGNGGDKVFDAHAKTSRLWLKAVTDTDVGSFKSYIEFDFNASSDERLTNQSSNGLRHAFVDWQYSDTGSLLAGQTWSTFFNTGALPEAVDFIGPTSGTIFVRQEQVRWTKKLGNGSSIMLSAENPSTGLNDGDGDLTLATGISGSSFDDNSMPDLVARYNGTAGNLSYSAALLGREIAYRTTASKDDTYGVAVSLSGKYLFDNGDDVKFMVNHGTLGRYIALQAFRDGAVQANGDIDLLDVTGGFVAYRHLWSDKLRSTLSYAMASADNSSTVDPSLTTESISNASINLMYSPTKPLTFGIEYMMADRELENGVDGDLKRLQFMTKYVF